MGQRVDNAALDDLLLVFHSRQVAPQPGRQQQPAELVEQIGLIRAKVLDHLVVHESVPAGVSGVLQGRRAGRALREHRADPAHTLGAQSSLQVGQQCGSDAAVAPSRADGHQHDPRALALKLRHRHAHDLVAHLGHHCGLSGSGGGHHLGDTEDRFGRTRTAALVPHLDRLIQVGFVVIA